MSLKFEWRDKQDGVDDILSEDINSIAHSVIENEEKISEISTANKESIEAIEAELDGKLDILPPPTNGAWGVYTCKDDGTTTLLKVTTNTGGSIPMRGANGVVTVGTPTGNTHAVPLGFADGRYVPQLKSLKGEHGAYIRTREGGHQLLPIGYGAATPYTLVARTDNGVVRVGEPRAYNDATTKKYVDTQVTAVANAATKRTYIDWKEDIESQYEYDDEYGEHNRGTYSFTAGRYDVYFGGGSDTNLGVGTFTLPGLVYASPDDLAGVIVAGDTSAVSVSICDRSDFIGDYTMDFWTDGTTGEHFLLDIDILESGLNLPTLYIHVTHIVL